MISYLSQKTDLEIEGENENSNEHTITDIYYKDVVELLKSLDFEDVIMKFHKVSDFTNLNLFHSTLKAM